MDDKETKLYLVFIDIIIPYKKTIYYFASVLASSSPFPSKMRSIFA